MCNNKHGHFLRSTQLSHGVEHILSVFAVEVTWRFIPHDDLGIVDQGTSNGNALLLPSENRRDTLFFS